MQSYQAGNIGSQYQGREIDSAYQGRQVNPTYQGNQFQEETVASRMGQYQNPYTENVLDRLQKRTTDRFNEAQTQRELQQAQRGAFGGSRAILENQSARRDFEDRLADTEAQQLEKAYASSAGLAGQDIAQAMRARELQDVSGRSAGQQYLAAEQMSDQANQKGYFGGLDAQLRAAGMLPDIAGKEQGLDLARLNALRGVGIDQQTMNQSYLDQAYRDFTNQRDAPRQSLSFYNSLLQGLGNAPTSSDVSTYAPPPNPYAQMLNMGLGAYSMSQGMG